MIGPARLVCVLTLASLLLLGLLPFVKALLRPPRAREPAPHADAPAKVHRGKCDREAERVAQWRCTHRPGGLDRDGRRVCTQSAPGADADDAHGTDCHRYRRDQRWRERMGPATRDRVAE